jgi:hypothetical protein
MFPVQLFRAQMMKTVQICIHLLEPFAASISTGALWVSECLLGWVAPGNIEQTGSSDPVREDCTVRGEGTEAEACRRDAHLLASPLIFTGQPLRVGLVVTPHLARSSIVQTPVSAAEHQ